MLSAGPSPGQFLRNTSATGGDSRMARDMSSTVLNRAQVLDSAVAAVVDARVMNKTADDTILIIRLSRISP